jgi:serine/threonine-protein kinase RsbT
MNSKILFRQKFKIKGGDYLNAGESSCKIRNILKEIGIAPNIVRRVAIAAYEAEMNVVMYAQNGSMYFCVTPQNIQLIIEDRGPGIKNIDMAMQPGYSTATQKMREMGFGAGMGLPNIKKNADIFNISSRVGKGTKLEININSDGKNG